MRSRGFPLLVLVCGTLISNGSSAPGLAAERPGAAALDAAIPSPSAPAAKPGSQQNNAEASPAPEAGSIPGLATPVPDSREMLPAAPPVSLVGSSPAGENVKPGRGLEIPNDCLAVDICIDDYLWWLYERTPKVDTNKVVKHIRMTFKKRGKRRTVTTTIARHIVDDFSWKDPIAAQRDGISVQDYVIGGLDPAFKLKLYHALRAMEDAGLVPGITSAFRDDYRQSIASGRKAASDSSYHGGSRRGGYGHGIAADLVSVKGETRQQRYASSVQLWKWIDAHEKELGVGRPYLDRDPPHVGPIDGEEYAVKRGGATANLGGATATSMQAADVLPKSVSGNLPNKNGATARS